MLLLETIGVAFSMFSALPVPYIEWNEKNMRYALCAFPLIGIVIALLVWGWAALCSALQLPPLLQGAGLCLIPAAVTGGIHLDGYADTCDARASHAAPEKKQQILKDPHLGAFAAIRLAMYFIASWALCACLPLSNGKTILALGLGFCLTRALSALAVTRFALAKNTGLAHAFASAAHKQRAGRILAATAFLLAAALCLCGVAGICALVAVFGVFFYYKRMCRVEFGGLSGDLAGWFLQMAELAMMAALVLVYSVRFPL